MNILVSENYVRVISKGHSKIRTVLCVIKFQKIGIEINFKEKKKCPLK